MTFSSSSNNNLLRVIIQVVGFNDGRFALLFEKNRLCILRPRPKIRFKALKPEILGSSSTFYDLRCFKQ